MLSDKEKLEHFLQTNRHIKYIRVQWIDYSGVLRARFVPVERCLRIANGDETIHLAQNSMLIPISTAPKIFPLSDHHETWDLRPDWSSLRPCGFLNNHATVMSFVDQQEAETRFDKCPRMRLVQALKRLEHEWGAKVKIGFEIEFMLFGSDNNRIRPMDRLNGYSRTAGLRASTMNLVDEILNALERSSIRIHHFHAEIEDQLEIALAPEPALDAVDSLVLAQETIRTPCLSGPLNGLHLHLSLDKIEGALPDNFLAGVLDHMNALCAFGMANYDGYVRSSNDAAGAWIGFGTDNRDMPVRKISDCRWEFRMMDGTSNPYLFAAVVLYAGLDGLAKKTELRWKDCTFFPHLMTEEMRVEHGMDVPMPVSLRGALDCLKKDTAVAAWIGDDLLKWYMSVKEKEVEEFSKMHDDQRRIRFLEYF
ncbi:predicted protein [Uncinocarpus reesii 1704]|uniref:Glutamine synthetase n=1 Tax=Uncinocarpus reesii (strain UAMH 1704) TaxID=336963 RepID=C4JLW4_UNCRE|nr:uncharacterized protein UREG_03822 [Uncinocarpus reesii 1704]EEP78976.1 predicted protein [Uncinocarpus reesii 1704]